MPRELSPCAIAERSLIKTYRKTLWNPFIAAVKRYELIAPGDKIAVCISGGKDSIVLAKLMQELQLDATPLLGLIEGCRGDIAPVQPKTRQELLQYSYKVASCVGISSATVMGASPAARDYAIALGYALQLVNILRDIEEDAARGRAYLASFRGKSETYPCKDSLEMWRNRAFWYLWDGLDYARRLETFRLRFTAMLPALLGQKTLRLIAQRAGVEKVKVSRRTVYTTLLEAAWLSVRKRVS